MYCILGTLSCTESVHKLILENANFAQGLRPPQPEGRHQVSPLKATTGIQDDRLFPQS